MLGQRTLGMPPQVLVALMFFTVSTLVYHIEFIHWFMDITVIVDSKWWTFAFYNINAFEHENKILIFANNNLSGANKEKLLLSFIDSISCKYILEILRVPTDLLFQLSC